MAACSRGGQEGGFGRYSSSAISTRARESWRNWSRDAADTGLSAFRVGGSQRTRRRPELAALGQNLDPSCSFFEACVTEAGELHAAFVERERLLERLIAFLEFLDDGFQLGDRGFEVLDGSVGHEMP